MLANDSHDPHGNHDHFADGLTAESLSYRIEGQDGSFNFRILGGPGHRDFAPFLAIDLNHECDRVFNQQISFDLRPIRL
jgi:hypothetical protein